MSKSRLFILALAMASFCVAAQAQLHSSSDYSFHGFYVGGNVGGTFNNADTTFTPLPDAPTFFDLAPTTVAPNPSGVMGGAQAGYNWLGDNHFMFGLETDMQGSNINSTKTVSPIVDSTLTPGAAGTFLMVHQEMNWLGTLRARAGFTVGDRVLIYGTGGMAYGHVKWSGTTDYTATAACIGCVAYPSSFDDNKVGWTAGGGFEFLASRHVAFGAEYLYYDLGDEKIITSPIPATGGATGATGCPTCQVQYDVNSIGHIVRGKINFKF